MAVGLSNAKPKTWRFRPLGKSPEEMLLSKSWTLLMISWLTYRAWITNGNGGLGGDILQLLSLIGGISTFCLLRLHTSIYTPCYFQYQLF